ncbi:8185_t:CDS:2 [Rhizophagus irregularis]|nr:8185_t:CDS:2 [Rhizophagus irregularis]
MTIQLGLSYEVVQLNSTEEIKSPEYLATKHPFGKILSLNYDEFQIYETRAIARYLINKYQGTKTFTVLIPSDVALKRHGKEPDLKIVNETREKLNKTLDVTTNYWEFSLADLLHIPYTFYAINIAGESELWDKRPNVSR